MTSSSSFCESTDEEDTIRIQGSRSPVTNKSLEEEDAQFFDQISSPIVATLPIRTIGREDDGTDAHVVVSYDEEQADRIQAGADSQLNDLIHNIINTYHDSNTPNSPNTKKLIGTQNTNPYDDNQSCEQISQQ